MADLSPSEALGLYELISTDSSEIKKLASANTNLKDQDLKNFFENYLSFKRDNVEAIQKLVDTITNKP